MKRYILIVMLLTAVILAGCTGDTPEPTTSPPTPTLPFNAPVPTSAPQPTSTPAPPADNSGYPALPAPVDSGYPAPIIIPTINPYPAAGEQLLVWMLYPVGEKCAKPDASRYPTLQSAMSDLTAAGVPVLAGEVKELVSCNTCGCPTEAHYRVQIDGESLGAALTMGWTQEQE